MRETQTVVIDDNGQSLTLLIEEMPAVRGAVWLSKFILLLAKAGVQVPDGANLTEAMESAIGSDAAIVDLVSKVEWSDVQPLLFELFKCVSRLPGDGAAPQPLHDEQTVNAIVHSPLTVFRIWAEVVKVNFGFFIPNVTGAINGNLQNMTSQQGAGTVSKLPPRPVRRK